MENLTPLLRRYFALDSWRGRTLLALALLVAILIIVRIALTPTIIHLATGWLGDQGIDAHIEDIEIGIMDGRVSLIEARGERDGKSLFHIGKVLLDWQWSPLSKRTISVTGVELVAFRTDIALYQDVAIVGGLRIPLGGQPTEEPEPEQDEPATPSAAKTWAAELGTVSFKRLEICYLQHQSKRQDATEDNRFVDYCLNVDDLAWQGSIGYGLDAELVKNDPVPVMIKGDFKISGIEVFDNRVGRALLVSEANSIDGFDINGLHDIGISTLTMQGLSVMQRDDTDHVDAIRYSSLKLDDIHFEGLNRLDIAAIDISEPGLYIVKQTEDDWEYQQWLPSVAEAAPSDGATAEDTPAPPFVLTLHDIKVTAPDMCYLDQPQDVYYCLTQNTLDWRGDIRFASGSGDKTDGLTVSGDLALDATRVRSYTLSRDLVDIASIEISDLSLQPDLSATLAGLSIDKLKALQRSEKDDDFTSTFNSLQVADLAYSNDSLMIETVTLTGLRNTLSKNKDGTFEHDKWQPKKTGSDKAAAETADSSEDDKDSLKIKLNKLVLDTEQSTLFIDNSTKPAMEIGLSKLRIEVEELDASRPKHDSKVKLHATTTKRSTIDLAGTARPFADKVSFDMDGELKGFDLKVATPATKQAIGHIIKSGQLDAELDLLAKDGQLDSNIALSLYQFQIDPVSKKDSAELDKKLGIPLNKTLILLRDKDDSIHLDIPITGDVNNPNFDPMDAIVKATTKAATVAAITFYTPYGLIYAGGNVLFDLATAMNFDPVLFDPGKSSLDDKDIGDLDKLAKLMTEKPGIHLTLCGQTNTSDLNALYPELKPAGNKDDQATKGLVVTEAQIEKLSSLADNRQSVIKDHLVEKKSISHDRLILCEPVYDDSGDAISGVEINI